MKKTPKAKRGDVFVLERTSVSTEANTFKKHTYVSYCFAIVAKVNRQGIVTEWTKHDLSCNSPVDIKSERVMLINAPALQAAARDIYSIYSKIDNFFTSKERISALVLDRAEALR